MWQDPGSVVKELKDSGDSESLLILATMASVRKVAQQEGVKELIRAAFTSEPKSEDQSNGSISFKVIPPVVEQADKRPIGFSANDLSFMSYFLSRINYREAEEIGMALFPEDRQRYRDLALKYQEQASSGSVDILNLNRLKETIADFIKHQGAARYRQALEVLSPLTGIQGVEALYKLFYLLDRMT